MEHYSLGDLSFPLLDVNIDTGNCHYYLIDSWGSLLPGKCPFEPIGQVPTAVRTTILSYGSDHNKLRWYGPNICASHAMQVDAKFLISWKKVTSIPEREVILEGIRLQLTNPGIIRPLSVGEDLKEQWDG